MVNRSRNPITKQYAQNHMTLRKVELRGSTFVKTDRINVYPAEVAVSSNQLFAP